MAAYCRVDGLVTCRLTACTPGSAPGKALGNEYGKTLAFTFTLQVLDRPSPFYDRARLERFENEFGVKGA